MGFGSSFVSPGLLGNPGYCLALLRMILFPTVSFSARIFNLWLSKLFHRVSSSEIQWWFVLIFETLAVAGDGFNVIPVCAIADKN